MGIDLEKVKKFYDSSEDIWPKNDKWHQYTKSQIQKYLDKHTSLINKEDILILNAGSGGNSYGIKTGMHHVDITNKYISHYPKYTVSTIEKMPFEDQSFDLGICVGSVINYCNALESIAEMSRVLKQGSYFFLEFESSFSMEFWRTKQYRKSATIIKTKYFDQEHTMWAYSPEYIFKILSEYDFEIVHKKRFHIVSSLAYNLTKDENFSFFFSRLDFLLEYIPVISKTSHNVIVLCRKN